MKALSLTQPWASLVAIGAKKIETRSWHTPYRGPLAIHAAKGLADMTEGDLFRLCVREPFLSALRPFACEGAIVLPRGAIIAVCDLVRCVHLAKPADVPPEPEQSFGNYAPGRYAWILTNVRRLAVPIPARGQLGLWEWAAPEDPPR